MFKFFQYFLCGASILILVLARAASCEEALKIGIVLPLSGSIASMGDAFRKGFELYLEEHPQAALKFSFEDSRYDGKTSIAALHKLHDIDKADLIVVWGNTPSDSCAPVAEERRIPMLGVSMNPIAKGRSSVVSVGPPLEKLVAKVIDQFKTWELKNPGAVSIDIGNALKGVEALRLALGDNFHSRTIANDETDFKTLIVGMRAKKIDGVFLLTMPEQAMTFIRQSSQLNFRPHIVGGDVFADANFRAKAIEYFPDLAFVYGGVEAEFIERLKKRWNDTSYFFETATGYTIAMLADSLARDGKTTRERGVIPALVSADVSGVPMVGFKLVNNEEYGVHFENDGKVYTAKD